MIQHHSIPAFLSKFLNLTHKLYLISCLILFSAIADGLAQQPREVDIVLIVDGSGSIIGDFAFETIIEDLSTELQDREIDARWGVVGFGLSEVEADHVSIIEFPDGLFTSIESDVVWAIDSIPAPAQSQQSESAWLAIEAILEPESEYHANFRPNASVHFIIITDEPQTTSFVPTRLIGPPGDRMKIMRDLLARDQADVFDDVVVSVVSPMDIYDPGDTDLIILGTDRHHIGYQAGDLDEIVDVPIVYRDSDNDGVDDFVDVNVNIELEPFDELIDPDLADLGFFPRIDVAAYSEDFGSQNMTPLTIGEQDYVDLALDPMMPLISRGNIWDTSHAQEGPNDFCLPFAWVTARRIEYQTRVPGDANDDGIFDSADFILMFQAAKYEKNEIALFEEGDANGDFFFNSDDFVFLFQLGHYVGP